MVGGVGGVVGVGVVAVLLAAPIFGALHQIRDRWQYAPIFAPIFGANLFANKISKMCQFIQ